MFLAHFKVANVWMSNRCTLLKPRHSLSFPLTWGGIKIGTWYGTINTKNGHSTHLWAPVNWHAQPLCPLEPIKSVVFRIASPEFRSAIFLLDKTPIGFRTTLRSQVEPLCWQKHINSQFWVSRDGKTYARNVLSSQGSQYHLCHSKTTIILSTIIKNSHSVTPQTQDKGGFACTNMRKARTGHRPAVRYVAFRQGVLLDSDPGACERRAVDQTLPHDIETENYMKQGWLRRNQRTE